MKLSGSVYSHVTHMSVMLITLREKSSNYFIKLNKQVRQILLSLAIYKRAF